MSLTIRVSNAPAWIQHAMVHKSKKNCSKYQRLHTVVHQTMLCFNYDMQVYVQIDEAKFYDRLLTP